MIFEFELNSSIDSVWNAISNEQVLTKWLCREASINLKKNGKFYLVFDENADHTTKGCKIISIEPLSSISFFWKGHEDLFEFMNYEDSLTTVKFKLFGSNPTSVIIEHSGFKSSEDWQEAKKFHETKFWPEKIQNLIDLFSNGAKD